MLSCLLLLLLHVPPPTVQNVSAQNDRNESWWGHGNLISSWTSPDRLSFDQFWFPIRIPTLSLVVRTFDWNPAPGGARGLESHTRRFLTLDFSHSSNRRRFSLTIWVRFPACLEIVEIWRVGYTKGCLAQWQRIALMVSWSAWGSIPGEIKFPARPTYFLADEATSN